MTEVEEWRPVVGFEDWYEISSLGRVKRIKATKGTRPGRILKTSINWIDYLLASLAFLVLRPRGGLFSSLPGDDEDFLRLMSRGVVQKPGHHVDLQVCRAPPDAQVGGLLRKFRRVPGVARRVGRLIRFIPIVFVGDTGGWAFVPERLRASILAIDEAIPTKAAARLLGISPTYVRRIRRTAKQSAA